MRFFNIIFLLSALIFSCTSDSKENDPKTTADMTIDMTIDMSVDLPEETDLADNQDMGIDEGTFERPV